MKKDLSSTMFLIVQTDLHFDTSQVYTEYALKWIINRFGLKWEDF